MSDASFQTACVIGTGMMGPGIALTLALGGVRTTLLSRGAESAAHGIHRARNHASALSANELVEPVAVERALQCLTPSTDFEASISGADLVIESGPEDLVWKQDIFARMDAIARPGAILASNTSGLSITAIAQRCRRPGRVLTTHFWNPAHLIPLVEIVQGDQTDPGNLIAVRDLLAACGKTPVVVRVDRPGQLGNRLQMALLREAANIVAEGIAAPEDVDAVIKHGLGLRMPAYGLFEHMDITGVDLGLHVLEYVARDLYNEPRAPENFRELVRAGNLGAKTGQGFYDWSRKDAASVRAERDAFVIEVLKYRRRRR
jgi:3-hydroxybutyryl-CoA dehydrogenase